MKRYFFIFFSFALLLITAYANAGNFFAETEVNNTIPEDYSADPTVTEENCSDTEFKQAAQGNNVRSSDYGFSVAGIPITSANAANITGYNITGSVTYDVCNRVLILNNATIRVSSNTIAISKSRSSSMLHGIELIGNNILIADAVGMDIAGNSLTIYSKSKGKLSVTSRNSHGVKVAGRFLVNNCEITVKGKKSGILAEQNPKKSYMEVVNAMITTEGGTSGCLENFKDVTLRDCALTFPLNAHINGSIMDVNGNVIRNRAVIEPVYGLKVAGIYATPRNASSITGNGISGSVSYDNTTQTLTLNNAQIVASGEHNAIKTFYNDNSDVKNIRLIGHNLLKSNAVTLEVEPKLTIRGNGKLSVNSLNDIAIHVLDTTLSIDGTEVVVVGKTYGIKGDKSSLSSAQLIIDNSKVSARGNTGSVFGMNGGISLKKCHIVQPVSATYDKGTVMFNNTVVNSEVLIVSVLTDVETPVSSLMIYPNPAEDMLIVQSNGNTRAISITDLSGVVVCTISITNNPTKINISHLPTGVYFVRVGNKMTKIVKK